MIIIVKINRLSSEMGKREKKKIGKGNERKVNSGKIGRRRKKREGNIRGTRAEE